MNYHHKSHTTVHHADSRTTGTRAVASPKMSRRNLVRGAAWSTPVILASSAIPAWAASVEACTPALSLKPTTTGYDDVKGAYSEWIVPQGTGRVRFDLIGGAGGATSSFTPSYLAQETDSYLIGITGAKRMAIHTITSAIHVGLRLMRATPRSLQGRWEKAARTYEHATTKRMADFSMRDPENWAVTMDDLYPPLELPFENITVKVARGYDAMMRRSYGDYMELPPLEKRRNHTPCEIDFGPYADVAESDPEAASEAGTKPASEPSDAAAD